MGQIRRVALSPRGIVLCGGGPVRLGEAPGVGVATDCVAELVKEVDFKTIGLRPQGFDLPWMRVGRGEGGI